MTPDETTRIVVLGCGVSGLTSALLLSERQNVSITIIAKHMPGDYDIEYASPWAGANYLPYSARGTPAETYERQTWPELANLATNSPEAGIHFQDVLLYKRAKDEGTAIGDWTKNLMSSDAWFKTVVPDFAPIDPKALPEGIDQGQRFTSVCINTALYLPWLASQCLKRGVVIKRGIVDHIDKASRMHHTGELARFVVNCTGLGSRTLGGVQDTTLYPARGQIAIVRNEPGNVMVDLSGTDDGPDEACYIMDRAAGGGCVLGGCWQENQWNSQPDPDLALRIMKRAVDVCPKLTAGRGIEALSIIRHAVGLRPVRREGIRVEAEQLGPITVIHNYGHGGSGYQTSYGCAKAVLDAFDRMR